MRTFCSLQWHTKKHFELLITFFFFFFFYRKEKIWAKDAKNEKKNLIFSKFGLISLLNSIDEIMVKFLTSATFSGAVLFSGRHLIWYECEMVWCLLQYSTITIKTSKDNKTIGIVQVKNRWRCSNLFTVNFDRILQLSLLIFLNLRLYFTGG